MGITQDINKLQEQMKVVMDLLRHPSKQAGTVLYLVETIQKIESMNFDLTTKWNTAVNYLQNKQLVEEYNNWCQEIDKLETPEMKQMFMMQPIDKPPKGTPTAPKLCSIDNPFQEGVTCFDTKGHEGDEHIGVDNDGKIWRWTENEDLGTESIPEAHAESPVDIPEAPPSLPEDIPEAPSEPEAEPDEDSEEPEEEPEDPVDELPEH